MLGHSPDKLQNLAADVFGEYVAKVVKNWISNITSLGFEWMKWFSGNLHEALGNVMLTSDGANEVTMRLLKELDNSIRINTCASGDSDGALAMSHLISALVHPVVTRLNFFDFESYTYNIDIGKFLSQVVTEMNMLKVLQLKIAPVYFEQLSFPNLQEFTLLDECDDKLLELLLVTCGNIRKLDISKSWRVTNKSVQFFMKFKHLEILNIMGTNIRKKDLTRLLTDLSKNVDSDGVSLLKSYSCNDLLDEHLEILVKNFKKLVMLGISMKLDVDVSLLRNLKHLQKLRVPYMHQLQLTLEVIGHQLSHLEVTIRESDQLCCISSNCPSLIYLKLDIKSFIDLPEMDQVLGHICVELSELLKLDDPEILHEDLPEITPLPSFKSLEVVHLSFSEQPNMLTSILTQCTNVRVLKIHSFDIDSNEVATVMLQNNPLEHLEELHWWGYEYPYRLYAGVGVEIVEHCKNLRVMYGDVWWSRYRSRKPRNLENFYFDERPPVDLMQFYNNPPVQEYFLIDEEDEEEEDI